MAKRLQVLSVLLVLTISIVSCSNFVLPPEGMLCVPGEETDGRDCDPSCGTGATHSVCIASGAGSMCVTREGFTCVTTPPAPCGGDERIGLRCSVCGVGGWWSCVSSRVECVPDTAPVELCGDSLDNNCDGRVDEGCQAACTPATEICDDLDNDCDGEVDEGCDDDDDGFCDSSMLVGPIGAPTCPHSPSGPGNDCDDLNVGINPAGTEVCDGRDNDCDGLVDEGGVCGECVSGVTRPCSTSCGSSGTQTCSPSRTWGTCNPPSEVCGDGRDNNCDGRVDEGCCFPSSEVCNGLDDDCDGLVDEGGVCGECVSGVTRPCSTSCGSSGTQTCSPSRAWGICAPPSEVCNGRDDDCDGLVDEGCPAVCVPSGPEVCDGRDNDCDGWTDEGGTCSCTESLNGVLTVRPPAAALGACADPAGSKLVTILWDYAGREIRSVPGATSHSVTLDSRWRGWVRMTTFCPNDRSRGREEGYWEGSSLDWAPLAGRTIRQVGFSVDVAGRDLSDAGLVCNLRDGYKLTIPVEECNAFACPPPF